MFYRAKLRRANVHFLSAPIKDGTTGTVIVLTTPDAQRTMLAYQVRYVDLRICRYYRIFPCQLAWFKKFSDILNFLMFNYLIDPLNTKKFG